MAEYTEKKKRKGFRGGLYFKKYSELLFYFLSLYIFILSDLFLFFSIYIYIYKVKVGDHCRG